MADERRAFNFSYVDLTHLLDHIEKRKDKIVGSGKGRASKANQAIAWSEISKALSSFSSIKRSVEQCRKKLSDLRRAAKKKRAYNRRQISKTGGGPFCRKTLTVHEERVLQLYGFTDDLPMPDSELGSRRASSALRKRLDVEDQNEDEITSASSLHVINKNKSRLSQGSANSSRRSVGSTDRERRSQLQTTTVESTTEEEQEEVSDEEEEEEDEEDEEDEEGGGEVFQPVEDEWADMTAEVERDMAITSGQRVAEGQRSEGDGDGDGNGDGDMSTELYSANEEEADAGGNEIESDNRGRGAAREQREHVQHHDRAPADDVDRAARSMMKNFDAISNVNKEMSIAVSSSAKSLKGIFSELRGRSEWGREIQGTLQGVNTSMQGMSTAMQGFMCSMQQTMGSVAASLEKLVELQAQNRAQSDPPAAASTAAALPLPSLAQEQAPAQAEAAVEAQATQVEQEGNEAAVSRTTRRRPAPSLGLRPKRRKM